jgi:predicted PurR-regulated permease PerM
VLIGIGVWLACMTAPLLLGTLAAFLTLVPIFGPPSQQRYGEAAWM